MPNHFQLEESRVVGQTLPASTKVLYSQRKVWCFVYYVQTAARPFRGPSESSEGDFLYQDKSDDNRPYMFQANLQECRLI